jgi:cytochrome c oxidase cbb3-type subunit I/II
MRSIGVPYKDADVEGAVADARLQGEAIAKDLAAEGVTIEPDAELVGVIAYLQRLGAKPAPATESAPVARVDVEKGTQP